MHKYSYLLSTTFDTGKTELVLSFLLTLKWVNIKNPPMDMIMPSPEVMVIGTEKTIDVTTIANNLLMQFKAAWCTTEIRLKI